jgi:hypothetical protein
MKVMIGSSVILFATLAAFVGQRIHTVNVRQAEREVRFPLSDLDSYVASMMNSPHYHETVFLSLSSIGKDENYLAFKPIEGGVSIRFPAFATSSWDRRQGRYAEQLRKVASSLSLPVEESSELNDDGSVDGVIFEFRVTGTPETVANTIKRVITQTFRVDVSDVCEFQYNNMPRGYWKKEGDKPLKVASEEFVRELKNGQRIYLGEREQWIFSIPAELKDVEQHRWNEQIWYSDLRELPAEFLRHVRQAN